MPPTGAYGSKIPLFAWKTFNDIEPNHSNISHSNNFSFSRPVLGQEIGAPAVADDWNGSYGDQFNNDNNNNYVNGQRQQRGSRTGKERREGWKSKKKLVIEILSSINKSDRVQT